jgi:hypothetical protein
MATSIAVVHDDAKGQKTHLVDRTDLHAPAVT